MAINSLHQRITLEDPGTIQIVSNPWITGNTKPARKIGEQDLPADVTLTQIQVDCSSVIGATGANPAIIRVYQYGRESSAATIEISSIGINLQVISLTILSRYGTDRKVIIDAWDPDTSSPNNTCSIAGTVSIAGRPYVDVGGASNQIITG